MGLDWFEQLLESMFRPKEDKEDATKKAVDASPALVLACQQIVDCLVESVSISYIFCTLRITIFFRLRNRAQLSNLG